MKNVLRRAGDPVSLILMSSAGILMLVLIWQIRPYPGEVTLAEKTASQPLVVADQSYSLPALDTLTETISRPLFVPFRKPGGNKGVIPNPNPDMNSPGQNFLLSAIMIEGANRLALIQISTGETIRLREGEVIDGWKIVAIYTDYINLSSGERQASIRLRRFDPPPNPLQPAPAGNAPAPVPNP